MGMAAARRAPEAAHSRDPPGGWLPRHRERLRGRTGRAANRSSESRSQGARRDHRQESEPRGYLGPGSTSCARRCFRRTRQWRLRAEVEDRISFGDRRRIDRRAEVRLDPLRCAPGRLVRAGLVVTDRHPQAALPGADGHVADEALDPGHGASHILLPPTEKLEELRRALPRIGPNDHIHLGLPFTWRLPPQWTSANTNRPPPRRPVRISRARRAAVLRGLERA